MIIGIDYRLANKSHRGMARYCREIVKKLLLLDKQNEYILYIDTNPYQKLEGENYRYSRIGSSNFILGEQLCLPIHISRDQCDIFWSPYNTFPVIVPKRTKLFVSIHDVIFLYKMPKKQSIYQKIGTLYRRTILRHFYKKINKCFTVSEFSRKELLRHIPLSIPIEITYNCISGFDEKVNSYKENNPDLKSKNYFFTLSGDAPSKNLSTLISVFKKDLKEECLIIGGIKQNSPIRIYESNNIHFLNEGISDDELIKVYLQCKCFLFCSKYEGFGIPIIEAAICRKPIIASNTTSIPEILNGQGILVEPTEQGIVSGINEYLNNQYKQDPNYKNIINRFANWEIPANIILRNILES